MSEQVIKALLAGASDIAPDACSSPIRRNVRWLCALHGGGLEAHQGVAGCIIREAFYLISDWMDRYGYHYQPSTASLQNAPKPAREKRPERKHHVR